VPSDMICIIVGENYLKKLCVATFNFVCPSFVLDQLSLTVDQMLSSRG